VPRWQAINDLKYQAREIFGKATPSLNRKERDVVDKILKKL